MPLENKKKQSLRKQYELVNKQIEDACKKSGRRRSEVRLLAVSKGQPVLQIKELYKLGHRDFGENYIVELSKKQEQLKSDCPDIRWHFIGQIQTNKLKYLANVESVQSLSCLKHARALAKYATKEKPLSVLLQIDFSQSATRGGVKPELVLELFKQVSHLGSLNVQGLMTILPLDVNVEKPHYFKLMQKLRQEIEREKGTLVHELSMGMSGDFTDAIQFGSTIVRVGTLLFGPRTNSSSMI